jgi:hypothetical protein
MLKIPISDTDRKNSHSFVHSSYLPQMSQLVGLPESSGGRVRSYPQPASSSSPPPPPWLPMYTYHPGDEQQACWWPQFWDMVSPHHNQPINQSTTYNRTCSRVAYEYSSSNAIKRFQSLYICRTCLCSKYEVHVFQQIWYILWKLSTLHNTHSTANQFSRTKITEFNTTNTKERF